MTVDRSALVEFAEACVGLVQADHGVTLDWTLGTLDALDGVCALLTEDGPLDGERLDLWWKLLGAYLGEVVVRTYEGEWEEHEKAGGAYAVSVLGMHGFPFSIVHRVLQDEPGKSLASFARVFPAVAERSRSARPSGE